ncbi:MAG: hypothetical protein OEV79_04875 [candidate division WOR-3 bacterium]|nr:hypothetical protein [candidate division WOR-3 bacterium]
MVPKDEIEQLMAIKGQVRGAVFETDAEYIRNKQGRDGLEKVEAGLRVLEYELNYGDVSSMEWMALSLRALSFLVMKDVFNWSDEEIVAMGDAAPKHSFIVKLFMKFFISPHVAFSHAPEYWTKHYDTGRLEAVSLDEETRHAVVRLYDFTLHPVYCRYLEGYFGRLFKFMFPNSKVKVRETDCTCNGDSCHEFLVDWEG